MNRYCHLVNKVVVLFPLLYLLSGTVHGQLATWMSFSKDSRKFNQYKVIGADNKSFFVYMSSPKERVIERYSYGLQQLFSKKLPFTEKDLEIEEVTVEGDHLKVFFSLFNRTSNRHGLFSLDVPFDNSPFAPAQTVFDRQQIESPERSLFKVIQEDELGLYAAVHYQEQQQDLPAKLTVKFLSNQLQPVQQAEFSLEDARLVYDVRSMSFDENGNLLMLIHSFDRTLPNSSPDRFKYTLYRTDRYTGTVERVMITGLRDFLNVAGLALDKKNHKILLTGLTSSGTRSSISGAFTATIGSDTFQLERIGFQRFNQDFESKLNSYKSSRKEKDLADYQVRHVVARSDGGSILVLESEYEQTQTYVTYSQGFPVQQSVTYHYFEEIVLLSLNPDGTIDWNLILPKSQVSVNDLYLNSFLMVPQRDNLRFIFNEDGRSKTSVLQFTVNSLGEISPRITLSPDLTDAAIIPGDAFILNEKTLLLPGVKRKKRGLFKIQYRE